MCELHTNAEFPVPEEYCLNDCLLTLHRSFYCLGPGELQWAGIGCNSDCNYHCHYEAASITAQNKSVSASHCQMVLCKSTFRSDGLITENSLALGIAAANRILVTMNVTWKKKQNRSRSKKFFCFFKNDLYVVRGIKVTRKDILFAREYRSITTKIFLIYTISAKTLLSLVKCKWLSSITVFVFQCWKSNLKIYGTKYSGNSVTQNHITRKAA